MAVSAPNYTQATNLAKNQTTGFNSLLNRQNKQQQDLFNKYYSQVKAQPSLTSLFSQQEQQYGLPQLQQSVGTVNNQISNVQGLLDNLDENTKSRTSGTFTTQALLDRQRAVEGGDLNKQLGQVTNALTPLVNTYSVANQNIGTFLNAAQNDRDTQLAPIQAQIGSLSDKFAREITGYTTSSQNELNTLLQKLQEQGTLYGADQQRAAQLAAQEAQAEKTRQYLVAQTNAKAGLGSRFSSGSLQQRSNGGFNFTDNNGNPISAATFAKNNGVGIGDLLYRMGQSGDTYAAQAYNQIKNNQSYYSRNPNALKLEMAPIFWGS